MAADFNVLTQQPHKFKTKKNQKSSATKKNNAQMDKESGQHLGGHTYAN